MLKLIQVQNKYYPRSIKCVFEDVIGYETYETTISSIKYNADEFSYIFSKLICYRDKPMLFCSIERFNDIIDEYVNEYRSKKEDKMSVKKSKIKEYQERAKKENTELWLFRSLYMDEEHEGKLVVSYFKFYPNGKVEKLFFNNLSNPFNPENNKGLTVGPSIMLANTYLFNIHFGALSDKPRIKLVRPADPDVIEVTMADVEKKFGKKVKIVKEKR